MDTQKAPNPFNPGSPVDPQDFVGRIAELENFRQKLNQTSSGSLANMAVVGGYGVGKTSFLHKCKAIAEEFGALTIYFSMNEVDNITDRETLARVLIKRVQEKVREEVILQRISSGILKILQKIRIKTEGGIELSIGEDTEPYPNLQAALRAAWNALKDNKKAIVFLLDEARVLEKNRADLVLYLRAVLEQLQVTYTPVMIIPAGKLTISGPSGSGFSPLVRTFPPAILENLSQAECQTFIQKKLGKAQIKVEGSTIREAYEVTEGHPFVLSAYMELAYTKLSPHEDCLTGQHLKAADLEFVSRKLVPFFSRFYDQAGRKSKKILNQLAKNKNGESTIAELSQSLGKEYNELSPNLAKLVQDGAIIRVDRGRYRLFHHLLGAYINNKSSSEQDQSPSFSENP